MAQPVELPTQIHVVLARQAAVGVVFRRGPSQRVCTLLWDLQTDKFTMGQWLKARIIEREADLSPDGKYLIYHVKGGKYRGEIQGAWTAVARAPYLKALALYANRYYGVGGGTFDHNQRYNLLDPGSTVIGTSPEVRPVDPQDRGFDPAIQIPPAVWGLASYLLLRDGWRFVRQEGTRKDLITVYNKLAPLGWTLRKYAHSHKQICPGTIGEGDDHALVRPGQEIAYPAWQWADVTRNRVVWAEHGKLYASHLNNDGLIAPTELRDFNAMSFEPIEAPY